jgi:hypothetical protein
MDLGPGTLFFLVFAAVVGYFVYRVLRHGGFRGAMFGARIEDTVGEVRVERQGPVRNSLVSSSSQKASPVTK